MTEKSTLESTSLDGTQKLQLLMSLHQKYGVSKNVSILMWKENEFIHFSRGFVNIDIVGVQLLG